MRHVLSSLFICSLMITPLWAKEDREPVIAPAPAVSEVSHAAAIEMPLPEAIESIVDEDEATRKKAFQRLEAATEADIPTLEKYTGHEEAEIRKQVSLLLQRLKRGTAALVLKFPDGTPAAGQVVIVKLQKEGYETDQTDQTDQVRGEAWQKQVTTGIKCGDTATGKKEVFSGELTADAAGKIVIGKFNDGDYYYSLKTHGTLPSQKLNGRIKLEAKSTPMTVQIYRGISALVTVVDEEGKPMAGTVVMNIAGFPPAQMSQMKKQAPCQLLSYRGGLNSSETSEKGVASLEKQKSSEFLFVAIKHGYNPAFSDPFPLKDGSLLTLGLKLVKTVPVEYTLTVALREKPLSETHILAVPSPDWMLGIGQTWNQDSTTDDIPAYVQKGAIDLGTTDAKGNLQVKMVPYVYHLLAFPKGGEKHSYLIEHNFSSENKIMLEFAPRKRSGRCGNR